MIISRKFLTTLFLIPLVCAAIFPFTYKAQKPTVLQGTVCMYSADSCVYPALKIAENSENGSIYKILPDATAQEMQNLQGAQLLCTSYILDGSTIEILDYTISQ